MIRSKIIFIGLLLAGITAAAIFHFTPRSFVKTDTTQTLHISIPSGANFVQLVTQYGIATSTAQEILAVAKDKYDLAKIVSGRELALVFDNSSRGLQKLIYQIDNESQLIAQASENETGSTEWNVEKETIHYDLKEKESGGVIDRSLYDEMTITLHMDQRLALALAEIFAWQIDFAADIQQGDSFKMAYEERYLDGQYVMPGKILAASFINSGEQFKAFYFSGDKTKEGYYDENGRALQKVFLKSPLQYKYISSGYSLARYNPITKMVSPHRGIDYAANSGTPAVSVGDGTVIQAGWNGYYGISVTVRHNDVYRSVYGHFSSLAKGIKVGAKIKQGQVVGYVGSTGLSTGPHLHFEIHKYDAYVNPFKLDVPPGDPVDPSDMEAFQKAVQKYSGKL